MLIEYECSKKFHYEIFYSEGRQFQINKAFDSIPQFVNTVKPVEFKEGNFPKNAMNFSKRIYPTLVAENSVKQ